MLAREADRLRSEGANVAEVHLREGPVVDEILDLGDELRASLIVMGSRGIGLVKNLLLGKYFGGSGAPLQASHIGRSRRAASLAS